MEVAPEATWDAAALVNPHAVADKARRVQAMFSAIAPSYDLNNRVHSFWIDQYWRRQTVKLAKICGSDCVVDVACGTGDLSLALKAAGAARVIGIDFTHPMLPIAMSKAAGSGADVRFATGDAMRLPLADACCDVVTIAFGIRNVADAGGALREFARALRPGGRLVILEFSTPTFAPARWGYDFYSRVIMPRTATALSGDRTGAYRYLQSSIDTFYTPAQLKVEIGRAGFGQIEQRALTFGVVTIHKGVRA
jgi:demethylmenaquinone methyltransferase / 2-methoxy-6-polyprenyl-1,4-benzoquinol methylase